MTRHIKLKGRVLISFMIKAHTGLHIGGSDAGIEIGGVDKTVIRDALTNQPYIPGSSLRGKTRSLLEKYLGLEQNQRIGTGFIHSAKTKEEYDASEVCQIFGVAGESKFGTPSRLVVRDMMLNAGSAKELQRSGRTDLPFTEVKTEVSIDRVTSAANPRQMERVPAGVLFGEENGVVMVYSIYEGTDCDAKRDIDNLATLVRGMALLEDDYLGGLGSRGSGKVSFQNIKLGLRVAERYETLEPLGLGGGFDSVVKLASALPEIQKSLRDKLGLAG